MPIGSYVAVLRASPLKRALTPDAEGGGPWGAAPVHPGALWHSGKSKPRI